MFLLFYQKISQLAYLKSKEFVFNELDEEKIENFLEWNNNIFKDSA